jgi:hypothetical protein
LGRNPRSGVRGAPLPRREYGPARNGRALICLSNARYGDCADQVRLGTRGFSRGSSLMSEPLPHLIEKSIQIAWDYLERTGEIADADEASRFLLRSVDQMVLQGERRRLMLANRAIDAYRHRKLRIAS